MPRWCVFHVLVLAVVWGVWLEYGWCPCEFGRDLSVHREYYRLQDHTELSKVSRLLMEVNEGNAAKFQGKKLNEINVSGKAIFYK